MELPVNYKACSSAKRKLVREEYGRRQEGKCSHCGHFLHEPPSTQVQNSYILLSLFPKHMFDHPIHLHHNRETGLTIGAVHARCNAWLWQYKGE